MIASVKASLVNINDVSRQLLLCILTAQNASQENTIAPDHSTAAKPITDKQLTELLSQRERLIKDLFKHSTTKDIGLELTLVNEMLALDTELTQNSQAHKQALAEQVLQLKKSTKVTQSYQRY